MNAQAHRLIMTAACDALAWEPAFLRDQSRADVAQYANYPDLFDDPTKPDAQKGAIDPDWRRFCQYGDDLAAMAMHFWPCPCTDSVHIQPMLKYLLTQATEACLAGDGQGAAKFAGCISHYLGDATQPAHLVDQALLERLVPAPPVHKAFHYHHDLEAITGQVSPLGPPQLLGGSVAEVAWRLSLLIPQGFEDCQQYVVPSLQAIFRGDIAEAQRLAGPPMTIAAQNTLHVLYTLAVLTGDAANHEASTMPDMDLCDLRPIDHFVDMVYGGILRNANRKDPPSGPLVSAKLRDADGTIQTVQGLGVLPHSGMNRPRDCFITYSLPVGVFDRFQCNVGVHAEIGQGGAVDFVVELDGHAVCNSGRLTPEQPGKDISVPLDGARTLTLRVTDANDGSSFWVNHAIWARPRLIRNQQRKDH